MTLQQKRRRAAILAVAIETGMATSEEIKEFVRLTNEIAAKLKKRKTI